MKTRRSCLPTVFSLSALVLSALPLTAATIDLDNVAIATFTEGFDSGDATWASGSFGMLNFSASGGNPDGYVSIEDPINVDSGTLFRGHVGFGSSNGAFAGDWIADGIETLSLDVRHDHSEPLSFFVRIATPQNFPAFVAVPFQLVPPGAWTTITLDVSEDSPFLINEGAPAFGYADTFSNVGNLQVGIDVVPEPTAVGLTGLAVCGFVIRLRRRLAGRSSGRC